MVFIKYDRADENRYPHCADVLERIIADGGFSDGWAMQSKPIPDYFFDAHVHYHGPTDKPLADCLINYTDAAEALDIKRALIYTQIYKTKWNYGMLADTVMDKFPYFKVADIKDQIKEPNADPRHVWAAYINYFSSEPDLIYEAAEAGIRCIKLHNAPVLEDNQPADIWLNKEWANVFKAIDECGLPVNFHATQRITPAKYTGGGRNSYWSKGSKNGVSYTNEDLFKVFLTLCERYPKINFIGAHQLHIGWEKLDLLFTGYPNLYVDTSCGCILRPYHDFYPNDKEFLRKIFIRWADRIIFGTDTFGDYNETYYRQHQHFINKLDLPQDVLDKVTHGNLERLCGVAGL